MNFHVEERLAWIRTNPHTVVQDRDPDFPRFREDPTGSLMRTMRVWLTDRTRPSAYLGSVEVCRRRFARPGLYRMLRRASSLDPALRRRLVRKIRRLTLEEEP
jgi:hypothetical protein